MSKTLVMPANKDIAKVQRVQNCLAREVTRSPRFSRSVALLKSLHWLPVHYRIIFKQITIAYQTLSFTQPAYLNSIRCRLHKEIPDSYSQSVVTPSKRMQGPELSRLPH